MSWALRFRLREHLQSALWPVPLACAAVGLAAAAGAWRLDRWGGWVLLDFKAGGATALTAGVVGTMITFVGIVFSVMLVAIQFASSQLTPRALKLSLSDPVVKAALGLFVATFIYALTVMARITDTFVPQLAVLGAGLLTFASLIAFLVLVTHVGQALRPANVMGHVGRFGRRTLEAIYPEPAGAPFGGAPAATAGACGTPTRVVPHAGSPGVVLGCDIAGLVAEARRRDTRLELVPAIGDFVPTGAPLFRLETGVPVDEQRLRDAVALGWERTLTQDPMFAFRILVDIAIKALSPAINDPTSAIIAIDQLHALLRLVGGRRLDVGQYRDSGGSVRLSLERPAWEDYVSLAVDEIRHYGKDSVQVARRLRAMLEDLLAIVPDERRGAVHEELRLLARTVERAFPDVEDRNRASVADGQGLGSS
jgi:uncharacterized membrane protein